MDINKYNCWNEINFWGVLCKKMRGWQHRRTHRCCCSVKCPETKALPLVAGDSSSSVHKLCPQVMSTPAAWRYRTLHLNSNLCGLCLLMFDSRMSAVADSSPCSSVTYVVCELYDSQCSPAFLIFLLPQVSAGHRRLIRLNSSNHCISYFLYNLCI
jgi:hypothetical protein